eukprot:5499130-Amphidinium_carterae.1
MHGTTTNSPNENYCSTFFPTNFLKGYGFKPNLSNVIPVFLNTFAVTLEGGTACSRAGHDDMTLVTHVGVGELSCH